MMRTVAGLVAWVMIVLMCSALAAADAGAPGVLPADAVAKKPAEAVSESAPSRDATENEGDRGDAEKVVRRTLFAAPLDNETGQEQYDPVAEGLSDLVSVFLEQHKHVTVVERQRLEALAKEQALSLKGLTGEAYAVKAGKLLEADSVLTGRVFLVDRKLTVSAKVLEIPTARVIAAEQRTFRPQDLMEASFQIARKLAEQMGTPLPEIDLEAIDKSTVAGLHLAKGLSHYYAGDLDAALMQFMRTIDLDPDVTEVHYWCGLCHWRLEEWAHAVIEWEKLLDRCPWCEQIESVKTMLAEARKREAASAVKRLGPDKRSEPETH